MQLPRAARVTAGSARESARCFLSERKRRPSAEHRKLRAPTPIRTPLKKTKERQIISWAHKYSCRVAWAKSDNDSLPGQGCSPSHASSDDEQPAILLLDDSTSSSHANQRRQASHPSDSRSTDSEPSAEAPGKYCAIASCCALRTTTVCLNPRPLKPVSLFKVVRGRNDNDSGGATSPIPFTA